jgi:hypothetical protein
MPEPCQEAVNRSPPSTARPQSCPERSPGLTAVGVHPGILATKLLRAYSLTGRPASEGAEIITHLCVAGTPVVNGGYYDEQLHPARPAAAAQDRRAVERLWKLSARLTGMG